MKTEANVSNKGSVTFLASQRINGRLVLVEGDTRVEAMGGLLHRLVELGAIEWEFGCYDNLLHSLDKQKICIDIEEVNH